MREGGSLSLPPSLPIPLVPPVFTEPDRSSGPQNHWTLGDFRTIWKDFKNLCGETHTGLSNWNF